MGLGVFTSGFFSPSIAPHGLGGGGGAGLRIIKDIRFLPPIRLFFLFSLAM